MNKMDKAMEQKNADRPVALKVEHVSKNFKLPVERAGSLKNMLFNWLRGIRGYRTQEVLKDITFDIKQGEFFGIVGKNGSGKSTLLKLISQMNACRFHIKGSAAEVMSVVNPDNTVQVTID